MSTTKSEQNPLDVLVLGGGAAGFFTAINCAQQNSSLKIAILEKTKNILSKVKISGGGRCNVTHAEFDPNQLAQNYPRGHRELKGPFHHFSTKEMISWLAKENIQLKTEADGRMFPVSDSSQTIIDVFVKLCHKYTIEIKTQFGVEDFNYTKSKLWQVHTQKETFFAKHLVFATGSSNKVWQLLANKNYAIEPPVASLFTFNSKDSLIHNLAGISWNCALEVIDHQNHLSKRELKKLNAAGPLLITHWGLSGPCVLKLSAWGAKHFHQLNYQFHVKINWLPRLSSEEVLQQLLQQKNTTPKKNISSLTLFDFPKRLWQRFVEEATISSDTKWASVSKKSIQKLHLLLTQSLLPIDGKSTFKDEFVTAGGVILKQIDFKSFGSKLHSNLYFAGEVLNIDAVTGGFNFQNAWTGGYLIAKDIAFKER